MKKQNIFGLGGIGIVISVSLLIVLGSTIYFNLSDTKINYSTDPNININGPSEFQNGVINFIDSFDFGSELKNFNDTPLNELTDDFFSKSMVLTHIKSINTNNNPDFTLEYNISYEPISDLSVSFSKTINSVDNFFEFNDSTFHSPIYAKFRWWNESIVDINEYSAFSHVFSEILLLNIYYYYDQHISCMSNLGYWILAVIDLRCNPLLIVSADIGHVPVWFEPSEHQLKYELYENLSTSVELNYSTTYEFILNENETHYYKIMGINQTYLQIKFTNYPSGIMSKIIFQGPWSSFSGTSTLRYSIRIVDDQWIYFYVYHRSGYENGIKYHVQLYTVPDNGQVNPTL